MLAPVLKKVSDKFIEDYRIENDGKLLTAVYSDGTEIRADLDELWIECDGQRYELSKLEKEGGIRFR